MSALGRNEPAYLTLHRSGELQARARQAIACLARYRFCPRLCAVNRLAGETGICRTGRLARVSSSFAHIGEDECLRSWRGSGTIYYARCSLRCVFCQNFAISQGGMGIAAMEVHRIWPAPACSSSCGQAQQILLPCGVVTFRTADSQSSQLFADGAR